MTTMDFSALLAEQKKQKKLRNEKSNDIISSYYVQQFIVSYGLSNFTFLIANNEQLEQILNLATNAYHKKNILLRILGLKHNTVKKILRNVLASKIQNGGFLIAVDKRNDKIVASVACADYYDVAPHDPTLDNIEGVHAMEIISSIHINKDTLDSLANGKYGVLGHGGSAAKDPDYKSTPFLSIFLLSLLAMLLKECGYKHGYGESMHPQMTKNAKRIDPNAIYREFDISNFQFRDGSSILVYFNALQQRESLSDVQMQQIKKQCKFYAVIASSRSFEKAEQMIKLMVMKKQKNKRKSNL
eukprot:123138_1